MAASPHKDESLQRQLALYTSSSASFLNGKFATDEYDEAVNILSNLREDFKVPLSKSVCPDFASLWIPADGHRVLKKMCTAISKILRKKSECHIFGTDEFLPLFQNVLASSGYPHM